MAQWFDKQFRTGKDSMKYLRRRSKRGGTNIKKVRSLDTSMVKSKEDFMNIIGLGMKEPSKKDNVEENNNNNNNNNVILMKKIKINSLTMLNIRKCSVVIVAERCSICKLPFKCVSDVVFHKMMRHGNDPVVSDNYLQSNILIKKQCLNIRRKRSQNTNNNNLFRLKLRIGEEIISEISMNRKHLRVPNSSSLLPKMKTVKSQKHNDFMLNVSESNVGIDSFDSTRNHYKDYVVGVQPFNRIQTLHDSLLNEDFRKNDNSNRSKLFLGVKDKNVTFRNNETVFSMKLSCMRTLSKDIIINNNNNSNIFNNIASISESNTFDKINTLVKTQPIKRVCNVNPSVEATEMHLTSNEKKNKKDDDVNDDEEIQEILRINRRRRTNNNNENIEYRLDPSINEDSLLFDPEEELNIMREKRYHLVYTIL